MSNLINKVKSKVEETLNSQNQKKHDQYGNNPQTSNYGSHESTLGHNNPQSGVGGYGNTPAYDQYGNTHSTGGLHSSNAHTNPTNQPGYDNPSSNNAGPHSNNLLNKIDPRVDSDRDGRNDPTSRVGGYGQTQTNDPHGHTGGSTGLGNTNTGYGSGIGGGAGYATGAHTGYNANTGVTPIHNATTTHTGGHHGQHGHHQDHHVGAHGSNTATANFDPGYDNVRSSNAGPHGSNVLNKLDPRVDSDRDGRNDPSSRLGGHGSTQIRGDGYGQTGQGGAFGPGGNAAGTAGYGTAGYGTHTGGYQDQSYTPGTGTASNTAGPHNSNLLNKLDPRVDSDLDGSRTTGGNRTHY